MTTPDDMRPDVQAYLASGKRVQQVPMGATGDGELQRMQRLVKRGYSRMQRKGKR